MRDMADYYEDRVECNGDRWRDGISGAAIDAAWFPGTFALGLIGKLVDAREPFNLGAISSNTWRFRAFRWARWRCVRRDNRAVALGRHPVDWSLILHYVAAEHGERSSAWRAFSELFPAAWRQDEHQIVHYQRGGVSETRQSGGSAEGRAARGGGATRGACAVPELTPVARGCCWWGSIRETWSSRFARFRSTTWKKAVTRWRWRARSWGCSLCWPWAPPWASSSFRFIRSTSAC